MSQLFSRRPTSGENKKVLSSLRKKEEALSQEEFDFSAVDSSQAEGLAARSKPVKKQPQIRVARSTFHRVIANKVVKSLLWFFAFVVLIYLCFALTIMRVVPTTSAGLVPVKNLTFEGGVVPAGEELLVDVNTPQGSDILDYLKQSFMFTNSAAVVRVEAGPYDKFEWAAPDLVVLDGQPLDAFMPEEPEDTLLSDSYLVVCLEGACTPGEALVIPRSHIIGDPLASYTQEAS